MSMRHSIIGFILLLCGAGLVPAQSPVSLENAALRVELRPADGHLTLIDKRSGETWPLGQPYVLQMDQRMVPVKPAGEVAHSQDALSYQTEWGLEFEVRLTAGALQYSFQGGFQGFTAAEIQEVQLLHQALPVPEGENSYYAVPSRMGLLLRADGKEPFSRRMDAYRTGRGYSMAMMGAVKNGSALLVTWDTPDTDLLIDYALTPKPLLTAGLALRGGSRAVRLEPLARGGYVEIAKAYRPIARQRGYLKTLAEKARENPQVARLFGAAEFKSFTFVRRRAHTKWNQTDQDVLQINSSFDEVARLAAHYRNDLGIEQAFLVVAGWIHRGYDNQHPDILPASPETGGNEGLSALSRGVREGGWLFGLHDNYQDLYRDAPSWNEDLVVKHADGTLAKGGEWVGGQVYLICSKKALDLISRPQNLPSVRKLFAPDLFFMDCIYANPPRVCFDPQHPETKADDILYKQKLADYVRGESLLFGGEEGYEWGVSHSDYFAGMLSHKTKSEPGAAEIVIPLFELVYGDCVQIYMNHRDRIKPDNPKYVLDLLLYGEMPGYFFGDYGTWLSATKDSSTTSTSKSQLVFAGDARLGLMEQFIKNTYEVLSPLNRATALLPMTDHRFRTADRMVESTRFGTEVEITVNYGAADFPTPQALLPQYGFLIESPPLIAFHGRDYRGQKFTSPTLFVIQSLDGEPLSTSKRVRIYRAFGDRRIEWKGQMVEVETEKTL
jgi:hypothetical protein